MMNTIEARLDSLESVTDNMSERLGVLVRDVAMIQSNYATKADIAASQAKLLKWFIATAITLVSLVFATAKFIN